jgi:hypothetical protein
MSSAILSLLISHILTFLESELIKAEPELVANIEADIKSLITKLETLISSKSPAAAAIANPVLTAVSNVADAAIEAAGNTVAIGNN